MNQPLYTVEILRLAASIPHLRSLPNAQGRSDVRSPTCGSSVKIEVALDDQHRVAELGQQVEACAFGQASAALLGMQAVGRSADEVEQTLADLSAWLDGARDEPGDWPGLMQLAPARARRGRHGAILLPFRALLAAIHAAEANTK